MPIKAMKAMVEIEEAEMVASIHAKAKQLLPFAGATDTDLLEDIKKFVTDRGFWQEKMAGRDTPAVEAAPDLQQTVLSGLAAQFGIRTLLAHDQALMLLQQFREDPAWLAAQLPHQTDSASTGTSPPYSHPGSSASPASDAAGQASPTSEAGH